MHKFLLARDSSAFQDMFDLPGKDVPCQSDKSQIEGYADRNPILLQSESEENFRVLLSVLYALYVLI